MECILVFLASSCSKSGINQSKVFSSHKRVQPEHFIDRNKPKAFQELWLTICILLTSEVLYPPGLKKVVTLI